jgi:hypothetical protein
MKWQMENLKWTMENVLNLYLTTGCNSIRKGDSSMNHFAAVGLVVVMSIAAFGQLGGATTYTPEKGSAERKAIVDALRVPVEKKLKQPVIFKIDHLKVQDGWAFLQGAPQKPDGAAIDYRGTVYQQAVDAGAFDNGVVALLRNVNGKWKVIQYVIGATDVPYVDWDKTYKAPRAIFPLD